MAYAILSNAYTIIAFCYILCWFGAEGTFKSSPFDN